MSLTPSTRSTRRLAIGALCVLALWKTWSCCGLFSDGAPFLLRTVSVGGFLSYNPLAREYAIGATQAPLLLGVWLGVTDLHQLARLFSLGALATPTALYVLALCRAKGDAIALSAVVAAIAAVFLPSSFFIVGEYSTGFALAIASATWLATGGAPRLGDGVMLVGLALFGVRAYEGALYLGPPLAAMTVWSLGRHGAWPARAWLLLLPVSAAVSLAALQPASVRLLPPATGGLVLGAVVLAWWRPRLAPAVRAALALLAASLFVAGAVVAAASIARNFGSIGLRVLAEESAGLFWQNLQLDLTFLALAAFVTWAWVRPEALRGTRMCALLAAPLVLLAALPLLAWLGVLSRPLGTLHYGARLACSLEALAIVLFLWALRSARLPRPLLDVLETPAAAGRCLGFSCLLLAAVLPSDLLATAEWRSFLEVVRTQVRARDGRIPFEDVPAAIPRFYWCCGDDFTITPLSIALRPTAGPGGVIACPRKPRDAPLPALPPRFSWRE